MQNELPATVHGKGKSRPLLPLLSLHREALCSARWVPSTQLAPRGSAGTAEGTHLLYCVLNSYRQLFCKTVRCSLRNQHVSREASRLSYFLFKSPRRFPVACRVCARRRQPRSVDRPCRSLRSYSLS